MNTKQAILNILAIYCLFEEIKQGGDCVDLREKSLSSSRKLSILISPLVQLSGQAAVEETNISVSSCQLLYIYTRGNVALIKLSSHLSLKIIRNSLTSTNYKCIVFSHALLLLCSLDMFLKRKFITRIFE